MPVNQYTLKGKPVISLDVIGGNYRITTHSANELLIDVRRTYNKAILPKVDVSDSHVQIGRQPLLRWFATKLGVDATIVVPEDSVLMVKMFSGELSVAGRYRNVNLKLRNGTMILNGPYFEYAENSEVKMLSGILRCHKLSEADYVLPLSVDKVREIENANGVPLRLQLGLVELEFS